MVCVCREWTAIHQRVQPQAAFVTCPDHGLVVWDAEIGAACQVPPGPNGEIPEHGIPGLVVTHGTLSSFTLGARPLTDEDQRALTAVLRRQIGA